MIARFWKWLTGSPVAQEPEPYDWRVVFRGGGCQ